MRWSNPSGSDGVSRALPTLELSDLSLALQYVAQLVDSIQEAAAGKCIDLEMDSLRVAQELQQGTLREVKVEEMHVERKIRLVYPAGRQLSHAARAFLEVVRMRGSTTEAVYKRGKYMRG